MPVVAVTDPAHVEQVRRLFQEYWDSFDFTPCFQNFSKEVAALPGDYAPPGGALGLAIVDGEPAGCAALRRVDDVRGEAKRLYVRPAFRGHGLGKELLEWIITQARAMGYRELVGDTMPVMAQALEMYRRMGFELTSPYAANPTPRAIYIRLKLSAPTS
jgi:GNAT superfamily N-acetyltransferase